MEKSLLKQKAIEYEGSWCKLCGYNRCNRSLHFHHLNAFEKDFNISASTNWEKVKEELDKCILVCANCHAEIEAGLIDHELLVDLKD